MVGRRREAVAEAVEEFLTGVGAQSGQLTGCSRRCSSPTSSARRSVRRSSETAPGERCSAPRRGRARGSRDASAGADREVLRRRVLAVFDGPGRGDRAARRPSATPSTTRPGDPRRLHTGECELLRRGHRRPPCTSARVSAASRAPGRCSSPVPCATSWSDPGKCSTDRGEHELKGVPGPWRIFAVAG